MTKLKSVKAWGGFVSGKLDWMYAPMVEANKRVYSVFVRKSMAKKLYKDVRPVLITEIPKRKRK